MTAFAAPIQILLVEDSPADIELTKEALRGTKLLNELHVVRDGEAAMEFVRGEGEHASAARPDLVLLDLNLPKKDGHEVLADMKADPELRQIPVVALTTSAEDADVWRAYDQYVNAYVQKPIGLEAFAEVARSVEDFWLGIVRLPGS